MALPLRETIPWSTLPRLVVATYRTDVTQLHVGLAYRPELSSGRWFFLHQGFHLATHVSEWTGCVAPRGVWAELQLNEDDVDVLITVCEIVCNRYVSRSRLDRRGLPYAIRYDGGGFDRASGDLRLVSTTGRGLTCATFVLALCESVSIRILRLDDWPTGRPGDAEWHGRICTTLEEEIERQGNRSDDLEHLAAVRNDVSCARFRPEEVVAGVIHIGQHPVPHSVAEPTGIQVAARVPSVAR